MPELPEVETVKRGLQELVVGQTVKNILVYYPQIITNNLEEFSENLKQQTLKDVQRRGKYLIFKFTDYDMLSHLRMEGKYQLVDNLKHLDKHVHVVFQFENGMNLAYRDVRKFGRMTLYPKDQAVDSKSIKQLGPEPVEEQFLLEPFIQGLKKSKKPIKNLLLEQKLVVGLGNIYVDEVLYKSKIHPQTHACFITDKEAYDLRRNIIETLQEAIKYKGTTIRSYENAFGENGEYQNHLQVYGREGQPCMVCQTNIEKIKLNGRGTHFCPNCQIEVQK